MVLQIKVGQTCWLVIQNIQKQWVMFGATKPQHPMSLIDKVWAFKNRLIYLRKRIEFQKRLIFYYPMPKEIVNCLTQNPFFLIYISFFICTIYLDWINNSR